MVLHRHFGKTKLAIFGLVCGTATSLVIVAGNSRFFVLKMDFRTEWSIRSGLTIQGEFGRAPAEAAWSGSMNPMRKKSIFVFTAQKMDFRATTSAPLPRIAGDGSIFGPEPESIGSKGKLVDWFTTPPPMGLSPQVRTIRKHFVTGKAISGLAST